MSWRRSGFGEGSKTTARRGLRRARRSPELLPILWSSGVEGSLVPRYLPHRELAEGSGLCVALAFVSTQPDAQPQFSHVTAAKMRDERWSFQEMLDVSRANLTRGLRIDATGTEDGTTLVLRRDRGTPAAGALALTDLHATVSSIVGGGAFLIGVTSILEVTVARVDQPVRRQVAQAVEGADPPRTGLAPTLLVLDRQGLRTAAVRR